jgi:hypothetical protein
VSGCSKVCNVQSFLDIVLTQCDSISAELQSGDNSTATAGHWAAPYADKQGLVEMSSTYFLPPVAAGRMSTASSAAASLAIDPAPHNGPAMRSVLMHSGAPDMVQSAPNEAPRKLPLPHVAVQGSWAVHASDATSTQELVEPTAGRSLLSRKGSKSNTGPSELSLTGGSTLVRPTPHTTASACHSHHCISLPFTPLHQLAVYATSARRRGTWSGCAAACFLLPHSASHCFAMLLAALACMLLLVSVADPAKLWLTQGAWPCR